MAQHVLTDARIYVGGYDLSGELNTVKLGLAANLVPNDNFLSGAWAALLPGVKSTTYEVAGAYDLERDAVPFAAVGSVAGQVYILSPSTGASGDGAFLGILRSGEYSLGGGHGERIPYGIQAVGQGEAVRGLIAHTATLTTTGSGTGRNLGTPTKSVWVACQVLSVAGTAVPTITAKLQSAATDSWGSPTDLVTLTGQTAIGAVIGSALSAVAGPWFRVVWTISGTNPSLAVVAAMGIV